MKKTSVKLSEVSKINTANNNGGYDSKLLVESADQICKPLTKIFTDFLRNGHDTVSWLDHVLSTTSGHSLFTNISVKSDYITSDHFPLCFSISIDNMHVPIPHTSVSTSRDSFSYNWYGASDQPICLIIIHAPELNLQKLSCLQVQCEM